VKGVEWWNGIIEFFLASIKDSFVGGGNAPTATTLCHSLVDAAAPD